MPTLSDILYGHTRGQTMPLEGLAALAAKTDALEAEPDDLGVWTVIPVLEQDNG